MGSRRATSRGFTLVELVAAMTVIAAVLSITGTIMLSASSTYARAADQREAEEKISLALDRIVRIIREAPGASGTPSITTAQTSRVTFTGGADIQLSGTTLNLTLNGGTAQPLCTGVTAFELEYRGDDGLVLNFAGGATPSQTRRIMIRLAAGGGEMRTSAYLRTALGGGS